MKKIRQDLGLDKLLGTNFNKMTEFLLFLDDYRIPIDCATYMYRRNVDCRIYHRDWKIVRSYLQFIRSIEENGLPDFISFDYDLADVFELKEQIPLEEWFDLENNREYTGLDCATWLIDYCRTNNKPLPKYAIHSANPDGAEKIEKLFIDIKNGISNH